MKFRLMAAAILSLFGAALLLPGLNAPVVNAQDKKDDVAPKKAKPTTGKVKTRGQMFMLPDLRNARALIMAVTHQDELGPVYEKPAPVVLKQEKGKEKDPKGKVEQPVPVLPDPLVAPNARMVETNMKVKMWGVGRLIVDENSRRWVLIQGCPQYNHPALLPGWMMQAGNSRTFFFSKTGRLFRLEGCGPCSQVLPGVRDVPMTPVKPEKSGKTETPGKKLP